MNNSSNTSTQPNHQIKLIGLVVFVAIIAVGVFSRLGMTEAPNFKPVAALALFAGFYFRRLWAAFAALGLILVISDSVLGFYEPALAMTVYGSMLVACLLGVAIQRRAGKSPSLRLCGRFAAGSIAMSITFFLLTNAAVWLSPWYPTTVAGLIECYVAAIPFFRATLLSDLIFSQALIAGYSIVTIMAAQRRSCLIAA